MSLPDFRQTTQMPLLTQSTQDEAFTLAYYLLGSETQAVEAVQKALAGTPARTSQPEELRLAILRGVGAQCQSHSRRPYLPTSDEISARLGQLSGLERAAAILVDVLGLSYGEAARVLGCSPRQAGKLLARARLNLLSL